MGNADAVSIKCGMKKVIIPVHGKSQAKVERNRANHSTLEEKTSQSGMKKSNSFHFRAIGQLKWNEKGYHSTSQKKPSQREMNLIPN